MAAPTELDDETIDGMVRRRGDAHTALLFGDRRRTATDIRHTACQLLATERKLVPLIDGLDLGVASDRVLVVDSAEYHDEVDKAALQDLLQPIGLPTPRTTRDHTREDTVR